MIAEGTIWRRVRAFLRIIEETGAMEAHRRLLELAARRQLLERIDDQSTPEFDSYRELIEAGCLKALDASSHPISAKGISFELINGPSHPSLDVTGKTSKVTFCRIGKFNVPGDV
jgi:hypothetical protein